MNEPSDGADRKERRRIAQHRRRDIAQAMQRLVTIAETASRGWIGCGLLCGQCCAPSCEVTAMEADAAQRLLSLLTRMITDQGSAQLRRARCLCTGATPQR
jgi:hypothetical protein